MTEVTLTLPCHCMWVSLPVQAVQHVHRSNRRPPCGPM